MMITTKELQEAYLNACEAELQALKPGNVSVYSAGHDMTVEDFRISALVSAEPITNRDYSLGEKIYYAVQATRKVVGCNTNLGIILLCAPLISAAYQVKAGLSLQQVLGSILSNTTVEDADWVFRAIRLAAPGGLGQSAQQDVHETPSVTLTQAMEIASSYDRIALQYSTNFKEIFDFGILRYNENNSYFRNQNWVTVSVYAALLSCYHDSHIVRKYGNQCADWVKGQMTVVNHLLTNCISPESMNKLLWAIDETFKKQNVNPGTTADLTVATLLAIALDELLS